MYIPKNFLTENKEEIVAFMRRYSFATLVTSKGNIPKAAHLPFVIRERNDKIILSGHFAKANHQWNDIIYANVLVIFSEPHAYISPKHYDKEQSVPTWNYFSVHAYGIGEIIEDQHRAFQSLNEMINNYEPNYKKQWDSLPEEYKLKMLNGIVPFEIVVNDIQASKKLSQNKNAEERQRIIDTLSKSSNTNEKSIADYMKTE